MTQPAVLNLRNVLVLVGLIVTAVGVIYFASEFIDRLSDWGKVLALILLTTVFVSLGRHFETRPGGSGLVQRGGWSLLRISTTLYGLALLSALTGVIVFLGIDNLHRLAKAGATIALGVSLILWAARRFGHEPPPEAAAEPASAPPAALVAILAVGVVILLLFVIVLLTLRGFS